MTAPPIEGSKRFVRPADYYSSDAATPILPRWVAYGCGAVSLLVLIVLFVGGAFLASGGFNDFMDFVVGMSVGEFKEMYADDVDERQKTSLDEQIEQMRAGVRDERVPVARIQPFLESMRGAMDDGKVTREEAADLEEVARRINAKTQPAR